MQNGKSIQHQEAFEKMTKFCAYQERCSFEVEQKLIKLGIEKSGIPLIILQLKEENYLNDERFADLFVRSKAKYNQWGKLKIKSALFQKKIDKTLIEEVLKQLDDDGSDEILKKLAQQKFDKIHETDPWKRKQKTAAFLISKGFEMDRVFDVVKALSY